MKNTVDRVVWLNVLVLTVGVCALALYVAVGAQGQAAPRYQYDPGWPKPMPGKWKIGGVTGLAVAPNDDTVWVYDRPNDLTNLELESEAGVSDCCSRPPSMIHIDKDGTVIGSFDAPQGHGMDIDSKGFAYLGQNTVRKYDTKTGKLVGAIAHTPELENGGKFGPQEIPARTPGVGGAGPVAGFLPQPPGAGRGRGGNPENAAAQAAARAAFRMKYPPTTPMIVGGIEEIRLDEPAGEVYVADNYLGGRVMVFDMNTFAFKRGWGGYGHKLSEISTNDADREFAGGKPPKEFRGHLTLNVSNDGLVYAADRAADRIHVTDKQGKFVKEFVILPPGTRRGEGNDRGTSGGVAFSPDKAQKYLFISDIKNNTIWFLNRDDGKVVGRLGSMGESGGQFFGLHMIATDSRGYIYTGEVFAGQRVQRFVPADSPRGKLLEQLSRLQ
jgi:DNA-binding beta-propeller fold protein YncE